MTPYTGELVLSGLTLSSVQAEAVRAHVLHGRNSMLYRYQSHERRLAILTEEVGEVAKELNEGHINGQLNRSDLVKELIQVAAMALTWVEALEGNHAAS